MSDLLSIGSSGVTAYQRALATVSNNIANVNTDGYTRQDVSLTANQPRQIGNSYLGTGTRFDSVQRQYDAFVESNLRNSNSDLESQKPLLSYVNRLIDVMGDESIGLTTAMNLFFESSRDLATDPASVVSRSIFLRDADGLAARFRQLAGQFELLDNETRQSVETDVGQVNALTSQLALMNKQLAKHGTVASQPSELLDQRDLLLRELSSLVAVKTKFEPNGSVIVSVGDTLNQGILVNQVNSRAISVQVSSIDPGKLDFVIDAYGTPESMPGISSGKIGGVVSFREQVLKPASASLDDLAATMTKQINMVHRDGIDAEGQLGGDLFGFTAGQSDLAMGMNMIIQDANRVAAAGQFRVIDEPLNSGTAQARISYKAPEYAGPVELQGDLAIGFKPQLGEANLKIQAGIGYAHVGAVKAGTHDLALTLVNPSATQQLQVMTRDGRHLIGSPNLSSNLQASLIQTSNGMESGATYDAGMLNPSGVVQYRDGRLTAIANPGQAMAANLKGDVVFPLNTMVPPSGIPANTFELNGRSLPEFKVGGGLISLNEVVSWINGSQTNLPVADQVIAMATPDGRLQISRPVGNTTSSVDLKLGAQAGTNTLSMLGFTDTAVRADPVAPTPAVLAGGLFPDPGTSGNIEAGTYSLDGYSLPGLNLQGGALTLTKAVQWINDAQVLGIEAKAVDGRLQIERKDQNSSKTIALSLGPQGAPQQFERLGFSGATRYLDMDIFLGAMAPVTQLVEFNSVTGMALPTVAAPAVLNSRSLPSTWTLTASLPAGAITLNGISLGALPSGDLQAVADWINDSQSSLPASSKITARVVPVAGASQPANRLELKRADTNTSDDIRLGIGTNGKPSDLNALGFDTTLHVTGGTPDDLLVFVTDSGGNDSIARMQSSMTNQSGSLKQLLRESPLDLRFVSDTNYEIVDRQTGSVLAERQLIVDTNATTPSIQYRGLKLEFSTYPKSGDRFTIDGNSDGIGNNEAMLNLVDLEGAKLMPGGLTITEAYIERVNLVGSVARQAAIAEQALSVVYQQAQEARDGISGVSLDEEASALVRFQQAYQANAKVMQTAMALFEAILQVR
jgi:flagellar hook-associated protein FlgK